MSKKRSPHRKNSRGYTLLEYCAGAAIIAGILWGALSIMGENMADLLNRVGDWAAARTQEIQVDTSQQ